MAISVGKTSPGPSVKTRYGLVQGLIVSMPSPLSPIEVFLGIPYATPPVGINRFSPTRNPQSWPGTRMTDRHGPACPQRFPTNLANETESLKLMSRARRDYLLHIEQSLARNQSEDCLHLNIYAPFQGKLFVPICSRLYIYVCTLASIYLFVLVDESLTNESDE
jgi:neuroligin